MVNLESDSKKACILRYKLESQGTLVIAGQL